VRAVPGLVIFAGGGNSWISTCAKSRWNGDDDEEEILLTEVERIWKSIMSWDRLCEMTSMCFTVKRKTLVEKESL
jgi:hypothetical protein